MMKRQTSAVREDDGLKTEERTEYHHVQQREQSCCSQFCSQEKTEQRERPPHMSDLRIVLLGKSVSENSEVGNFLLGRAAFDSEAPPDVVERVGGRLKDRHVMVINSPQLLQTNISDHQITQTVRECVYLSDPGPHVFILVLQYNDFTEEDMRRVKYVLKEFSDEAIKCTIVITTDEETDEGASVKTNELIQQFTAECGGGHVQLDNEIKRQFSGVSQQLEKILRENNEDFLTCDYDAEETLVDEDQSRSFASLRTEEDPDGGVSDPRQQKLNLVLCGSDETLKNSVSKLIREKKHVELHGRQISLVDLPALFNTRLSEEEVMRQTLRCVSLCDPGVHVFLLIIPDAPLNNEDKAEMEEIQKIFSSRINKHMMILIMQSSEHQTAELNEETQSVIERFGGRHHFFGPNTQVSTLMENIEKMLEENRGEFFSTETFLEAQMKKLMKYEEMKKKINSLETHLLSPESEDDVRIVLLGKTGVGKSATGNTILGRDAFIAETSQESVTKEIQRETTEIKGRLVTVIDTPGLFDPELTNEEIQREISHCISMILPGPHVFIIVLNLGQRFTQEEETSVKIIQETFGEKSLMYTMVLFTRGDDLKNKTIEQCLGKPGSPLMKLIEACGNRYHVFNNNQTGDRTQVSDLLEKIDNMVTANGGSFYSCKMFRQMEREKQEQQMKILMDRVREREELIKKHEEEKERMKMTMDEERQNHDEERKRREEELKREIREQEKHQREIRDEMRRERETFKHEIEEMRQEKEKVKTETEKLQIKYESEIDRLMNEKERKKREKEFNEREAQQKTFEEKLKLLEEQHEDELKRRQVERREEYERQIEDMKMICSETDDLLQVTAYRKLETEFSKWSWRLHSAMIETENKLYNKIENEAIHEVKETDLQRELKKTSEEVEKSMLEFFEKDTDKYILIQWKTLFKIKIKKFQENIVRETKRKLNEILQQRDLKKKIDAQRTYNENTLYEKSKELALKLKDKANDEQTLKKEFDLFWENLKIFREAIEPVRYIEKKREEYYSIFMKYCHGAASAAIFGEIICQKLKEPIEQSVYKKTARDLTDEMRSNCQSLNGNRSNLEKHILKTLAEEEDFNKYMNYIKTPRDHFKSFIRDEVSQYITDKFSVSILPKMKENIELLQQKIVKAAHKSTKYVQVNRGDVGLWLKSFTQQLSDELIFSVKDLSGVKHDDVDDFNLLEDVIVKELTIMSDISMEFNIKNLDLKFRPDEILIDHFCQCCWVQCPFCGAICTNTIENHHGDHSVPFHRNNGLNGWFYIGTTNLSINICTSAVASNDFFYPHESDKSVPWRDYRTAGGVFANWSITPDLSELPYWKWFVCRFQRDLEKYYKKTFEGSGVIPDEWRKYSKQDAFDSLDTYI